MWGQRVTGGKPPRRAEKQEAGWQLIRTSCWRWRLVGSRDSTKSIKNMCGSGSECVRYSEKEVEQGNRAGWRLEMQVEVKAGGVT